MLSNSFTKWLWDNRRSVLGWAAALAGVGGMYAAFWPSIDNPQMREALENYPEAVLEALNFDEISTAAGYLNASVYGLVVALLSLVYATSAGTRIIAGDEDSGTLDLVLAHPVSRSRLALERFAALLVSLVLISVALLLVMLALTRPARLEGISLGDFAAMHLHLFLFAALFGSVAFAVGAATGRRGVAIGTAAGVAVLGFAANGIISGIEGLGWIEGFSPFQWLNGGSPLANGVQAPHVSIMTALIIVLTSAGVWGFSRRDIGV
ncbi:MAG TPA: ABC transporter permease subunit [Acidimicrobiia bacterium]|nr:ABC transporter permease subunit [Acidimicrobiia bacterium]